MQNHWGSLSMNKQRKTVGVDWDLSVCDVVTVDGGWIDYLNGISKHYHPKEWFLEQDSINYDISVYYPDLTEDEAHSFWKDKHLYQKMEPYHDAVQVINKLAADGHNIVFISHCQQLHYKSKVQAAKEWFDIPEERFGFLATREKRFAKIDVLIDDRNIFLNSVDSGVLKIKIDTPYTQDEELKVSLDLCTSNWYDIYEFLQEYL